MNIPEMVRPAAFATFGVAVMLALTYQLHSSREAHASTIEALRELSKTSMKSEIEREASIALSGKVILEGKLLGDRGQTHSSRWQPIETGTSIAVLVTPSCPYSLELIEGIVRDAEEQGEQVDILVASLAGDERSLKAWMPLLDSPTVRVSYLLYPRNGGRRLSVAAVPILFRWVDGQLVDVRAGREQTLIPSSIP